MRNRNVADDGRIEAEIDLVFDAQLLLQQLIEKRGITRAELARRVGITKARLSQLMRAEANPTFRTIAGLFHALGEELSLSFKPEKQAADAPAWKSPGARRGASAAARQDEVLHALLHLRPATVSSVAYAGKESFPDTDGYEQAA